jgi:hypothetical protein
MDMIAHQIAQRELRPGEVLKWFGRPTPRAVALRWVKVIPFLLGLFFAAAAAAALVSVFGGDPAPSKDVLAAVALPLAALWLISSIPLAWLGARSTIYGVTNQRIFIVQYWPWSRSSSWGIGATNTLERRERRDGWGNLVFHEMTDVDHTVEHGFYGIPDVRKVEVLIAGSWRKAMA